LGLTRHYGSAMFGPKHTPVGTCEINRKFSDDRRVSPQVLLQCMFSLKHTLKIHIELGVSSFVAWAFLIVVNIVIPFDDYHVT